MRLRKKIKMGKPTIKDIAEKMNVSAATVSNALNGKAGVAESKRKKIMETARLMGYQPNVFAKNLVNQKSLAIGLIVSSISDPFYPELARGVQERAGEQGYGMMLFNTNHDKQTERNSIETLNARGVDGIILSTVLRDDPNIGFLRGLDIPFVLVNRHLLDPGSMGCIDSVVLDNYQGGYASAHHLLKMGHKRISIIAGSQEVSTASLRLRGALDAVKAFDLPDDHFDMTDCGYMTDKAYDTAKKILNKDTSQRPTAFLCHADNMALGVREAVFEAGMRIPEDISLIGFDDIAFASVSGVELTTVAHRQYEMGLQGAQLLIEKITEAGPDNADQGPRCHNIILEPKLVVRKSCGFHLTGYTNTL